MSYDKLYMEGVTITADDIQVRWGPNEFTFYCNGSRQWGLPISRVAPLDQLLPLSLGSSG